MNRVSLRTRIFLAMLLLVGLASVLIAVVTVKQYKKQTEEYYYTRFDRKEKAAQKTLITNWRTLFILQLNNF